MSAWASPAAESRCSFGPACSVRGLTRSSSSLPALSGSTAERRSYSTRPPSECSSRIASSDSTGASCQPSPRSAGARNSPTGRSTRSTAGSCSPASASHVADAIRQQRRSPASNASGWPSSQRERSPACSPADAEPGGERAALVVAVDVDGRVVERDRQPGVGAPQRRVELRRRDVEPRPVQAGVAVGARLAVDQRPHGLHRQPRAVEAGDAVAAQHDLRVRVGAAPAVGVVGVHRLVGREPRQRPPAEALQHSCRARAAAPQLGGGVGVRGPARSAACARAALRSRPPSGARRSTTARERSGPLRRRPRQRGRGHALSLLWLKG